MFENGRPRYWIDWYDPWYLILPLLLAGVLAGIRWLPASLPARLAVAMPTSRMPAARTVPLPVLAPAVLESPMNGKGFYQSRMPDAEGRAEPGAVVCLDYARLDLRDPDWRLLAQMPADPAGRFHFKLQNFPPGSYRLRVRLVTDTGVGKNSSEAMVTVFADPVAEPRRRARR